MPLRIALVTGPDTDPTATEALARRLRLPALSAADAAANADLDALLYLDGDDLSLRRPGPKAPGPVRVDFGAAPMRRRRRGGHNELLGRAVGVSAGRDLTVLDATAGLGRDSFVLADLGCRVLLSEREPVVGALLASGLTRAAAGSDPWLVAVAARMQLWPVDARALSVDVLSGVDVIYLDPMFPPRSKSAAVKKDMALFQDLLEGAGGESDSEQLLAWALAQPVARVVVKRPLKASPLAGRRPSHELRGKAVRFDVHVLAPLH